MPPTLKLTLKCLIGWFLLAASLFVAHFLAHPVLWPQLTRLALGLVVTLLIVVTLAGLLATTAWVMSQFRLFDDEYWY